MLVNEWHVGIDDNFEDDECDDFLEALFDWR
jgi:hypothetical protein